jgi:hypothetical protein
LRADDGQPKAVRQADAKRPMTDIDITDDYEPFLMRERAPAELADYDAGFKLGEELDDTTSFAWQTGWGEEVAPDFGQHLACRG